MTSDEVHQPLRLGRRRLDLHSLPLRSLALPLLALVLQPPRLSVVAPQLLDHAERWEGCLRLDNRHSLGSFLFLRQRASTALALAVVAVAAAAAAAPAVYATPSSGCSTRWLVRYHP